MTDPASIRVAVLGGGPDAERPVSLQSAAGVADALRAAGFQVLPLTVDRPTTDELASIDAHAIFPVLHGRFGEGGELQRRLAAANLPFVGSHAAPARLAMDKIASKLLAASLAIPTAPAGVLDPAAPASWLEPPVVCKPIHEGSSVGLSICRDADALQSALAAARAASTPFMIEQLIPGRELTVAILDNTALPIIEITPAEGVYDYAAKYDRDDTRYTPAPQLPPGITERLARDAHRLCAAAAVRHLARVDFILDPAGTPWFLELNTMPGFTSHSLFPMAARAAGIQMPPLCARLVHLALRDHAPTLTPQA